MSIHDGRVEFQFTAYADHAQDIHEAARARAEELGVDGGSLEVHCAFYDEVDCQWSASVDGEISTTSSHAAN